MNFPHLTEEVLEEYSMGRLSETETERVEDHLFVCHSCQDLQTQTDEYVQTMKVATQDLLLHPVEVAEPWWKKLFAIPKPMLAAAACAALALVFFIPRDRQFANIELQTLRGPEAPAIAPADASLNLRLSLRGLDSTGPLRVEIADASGHVVLKTEAERAEGLALAKADALAVGVYWVRLYSNNEMLREYGLNVRDVR